MKSQGIETDNNFWTNCLISLFKINNSIQKHKLEKEDVTSFRYRICVNLDGFVELKF